MNMKKMFENETTRKILVGLLITAMIFGGFAATPEKASANPACLIALVAGPPGAVVTLSCEIITYAAAGALIVVAAVTVGDQVAKSGGIQLPSGGSYQAAIQTSAGQVTVQVTNVPTAVPKPEAPPPSTYNNSGGGVRVLRSNELPNTGAQSTAGEHAQPFPAPPPPGKCPDFTSGPLLLRSVKNAQAIFDLLKQGHEVRYGVYNKLGYATVRSIGPNSRGQYAFEVFTYSGGRWKINSAYLSANPAWPKVTPEENTEPPTGCRG